jgi:hypothetical protein
MFPSTGVIGNSATRSSLAVEVDMVRLSRM